MKKLILLAGLVVLLAGCERGPKYVFYFIGDGMGHNQVALTEAWLASQMGDSTGFKALNFMQFPAVGFATTHCADRRVTDSAAAGTALAAGQKTSVGTIGMSADHSEPLRSVAEMSRDAGFATGVVTSVSIDHATPASFYAHQPNRNSYYEIAAQMAVAGLDLYAGAGLINPTPAGRGSVWQQLADSGYTIYHNLPEVLVGERVVMVQPEGYPADALPRAVNAKAGDVTLPLLTRRAVDFLYEKGKRSGFFLMVEGGQIDWTGHDNDARALVYEVQDFAAAIEVALSFYREHPDETLIVVTADHETGGLGLGNRSLGYDTHFEQLSTIGPEHPQADSVTGVGWTTGAHTAAYVPVFAIGAGSETFCGRMDNTDIPQKISRTAGF